MKKTSAIILSVLFVFLLSACKSNQPAKTPSTTQNTNEATGNNATGGGNVSNKGKPIVYKDGTYDVKHKSTKPGYEEAVVSIANGKIGDITLKRLDDNSKEIDYNTWDGKHDGYPNLKQARLDLAKAMISKQSTDVDAITGATQSSNGWKAAVADALSKAQ